MIFVNYSILLAKNHSNLSLLREMLRTIVLQPRYMQIGVPVLQKAKNLYGVIHLEIRVEETKKEQKRDAKQIS